MFLRLYELKDQTLDVTLLNFKDKENPYKSILNYIAYKQRKMKITFCFFIFSIATY